MMPGTTDQRRRLTTIAVAALCLGSRTIGASPASQQAQILRFTGGPQPSLGRVRLDLPEIVENGNSVPVTIRVDSPMTDAEHVRRLALFTERNPQPDVIEIWLGPRAGRAQVSLRMRMAESQTITAVAELSDASHWMARVEVVVALAACLE